VQLELESELTDVGLDGARVERISGYFDDFVAAGRLSGWLATINRAGKLAWVGRGGHRDRERMLPVTDDTIWRLYSMTKPLTAVAALMLYEEGCFDLNDEVSRWIEELADAHVYASGPSVAMTTTPAIEPVRVQHLFTHTAGFTYGFQNLTPLDALYRARGYDETQLLHPEGIDLAGAVHDWCSMPLLFEPGSAWNYSVATDVLGRLVEIWSGMRLDEFFARRLLGPLGMSDTNWFCPPDREERLSMLYVNYNGQAVPVADLARVATREPTLLMGGGGLVTTAHDYQRFMSMLLGGGELEGTTYLQRRTVEMMTQNHLPENRTLAEISRDSFSEVGQAGVGYGLGVSVVVDPTRNKSLVPRGTFGWGGAASTYFWVDPSEELSVALYTQLLPSWSYPWRRALQQLVYSSLRS
jgi:CubicO group peptidase (beta-lactamase class C family)